MLRDLGFIVLVLGFVVSGFRVQGGSGRCRIYRACVACQAHSTSFGIIAGDVVQDQSRGF